MKKSFVVNSLWLIAALPLLAGCIVEERRPAYAPPPAVVVEEPANPPPARVEVVPAQPDVTFVWIPGCWEWRGGWVWVAGRWAPPPHPGAFWVRGHWVRHRHGYLWVGGHWR